MHTLKERNKAVKKYLKYKKYSKVINELGYPNVRTLRRWVYEYKENGFLHEKHKSTNKLNPNIKFSEDMINNAIEHYNTHGKCIAHTIKELGYPSRNVLKKWLLERDKNYIPKIYCFNNKSLVKLEHEEKVKIVKDVLTTSKTISTVARENDVCRKTVYEAIKQLMPENGADMKKNKEKKLTGNKEVDTLIEENNRLEQELKKMEIERDIYKKASELFNKSDKKFDYSNKEKTIIVKYLTNKYKLIDILEIISLSKSSYFYNLKALSEYKYTTIELLIKKIFEENYECYGYRRIKAALKKEYNINISEKVVRKLTKKLDLNIRTLKKKKYSSYKGEITPEVENLLKRDFHSENINEKWLTDITEFHIPAGKIYLSPIIDCYDGDVVSWSIGTSPNAELANSMLKSAINISEYDELIVHSDRGCHYRWPEWIDILSKNNITRSMSKKGCSPDNSACEGFFGRLKNEFFYKRDWKNVTIEEFIKRLNDYIVWYKEKRIKISLNGLSPVQYRTELGLV